MQRNRIEQLEQQLVAATEEAAAVPRLRKLLAHSDREKIMIEEAAR